MTETWIVGWISSCEGIKIAEKKETEMREWEWEGLVTSKVNWWIHWKVSIKVKKRENIYILDSLSMFERYNQITWIVNIEMMIGNKMLMEKLRWVEESEKIKNDKTCLT